MSVGWRFCVHPRVINFVGVAMRCNTGSINDSASHCRLCESNMRVNYAAFKRKQWEEVTALDPSTRTREHFETSSPLPSLLFLYSYTHVPPSLRVPPAFHTGVTTREHASYFRRNAASPRRQSCAPFWLAYYFTCCRFYHIAGIIS